MNEILRTIAEVPDESTVTYDLCMCFNKEGNL